VKTILLRSALLAAAGAGLLALAGPVRSPLLEWIVGVVGLAALGAALQGAVLAFRRRA
jgi:hypothetical protein